MSRNLFKLSPMIPLLGAITWCGKWQEVESGGSTGLKFAIIFNLGGLLAMIITWAAEGKPHYVSEEGSIPCKYSLFAMHFN